MKLRQRFVYAVATALGASLAAAAPAAAHDSKISHDRFFSAGDWTIMANVGAAGIGAEDASGDYEMGGFIAGGLEAGYFVTDNIAIGIAATAQHFDVDTVSATGIGLLPNVNYFFDGLDHFVPYLGVHAGYSYYDVDVEGTNVDDDDDGFAYGAQVGAAIPLNGYSFVDVRLTYSRIDLDVGRTEIEDLVLFNLGYRLKF